MGLAMVTGIGRTALVLLVTFIGSSCVVVEDRGLSDGSHRLPSLESSLPRWTVNQALYEAMEPGAGSINIVLADQRLTLLDREGSTVIETDCSTGMVGKETPQGHFHILGKIQDKRSNRYGSYVSESTREIVEPRSWLVARPPGTRFLGTSMPYWMRVTWAGVGIHVGGFQRGQRTSMGCIRMPEGVQPLLFEKSAVGMRVRIE